MSGKGNLTFSRGMPVSYLINIFLRKLGSSLPFAIGRPRAPFSFAIHIIFG
jgi:hypothetical protein